jgi:hypothetical protein
MKTVLFIGHHKVGTTSLQRFLAYNYAPLLAAGILYPGVEREGLSHNIKAVKNSRTRLGRSFNVIEPHNGLAFKMLAEVTGGKVPPYHGHLPDARMMLATIQRQIDTLSPRAMILCAEVFANFATVDTRLIQTLKSALEGHDIHIICTLRRPDDYLVSWHGQRLKFGHKIRPLRAGAQGFYFDKIHFDYRLMLEGWVKAFPEAEITVRDYKAVMGAGGSVEDFIACAGLDFPRDLKPVGRANAGFGRALMEIARLANHQLPPPEAEAVRAYLLHLPPKPDQSKNNQIEMFGAVNRQALLERFSPINQYLGQFSSTDNGFFDDISQMGKTLSIPELEATSQALTHIQGLSGQPAGVAAFLAELQL